MPRVRLLICAVAVFLSGTGCRVVRMFDPNNRPAVLEQTPRDIPQPDVSATPELPSTGSAPLPPLPNYYRLSAEECRSLACQNTSVANLLETSATMRPGPTSFVSHRESADWVRVVTVRYLSQEARNRTAGAALTLYYKLLEAELKSDILAAAIVELDALVKANETLLAKGFKQTADSHELKKQRIELLAEQMRLRAGVQKLNAELKALLAFDPNTQGFLLPADQIRVVPEPLDADQAVQLGQTMRADLNLLRSLTAMLDHRTLAAIRQSLVAIAPPLAAVQKATEAIFPPLTIFVTALGKAEAATVRQQLSGLLKDREREATKDIRNATDEWDTARNLVTIARARVELLEARVTELTKKTDLGMGSELELRKAKLELLKAKAELTSEAIRWKLADIKARETMGLLCCE